MLSKLIVKNEEKIALVKDFLFHSIRVKQEFTYKGRIDGDSYYTMYVNLIRACKKVLYQLVYIVGSAN